MKKHRVLNCDDCESFEAFYPQFSKRAGKGFKKWNLRFRIMNDI